MNELPLANGIVIDTRTGQPIAPSVSASVVQREEDKDVRKSSKSDAADGSSTRDRAARAGRDRTNRAVRTPVAELPADPRAITTVGIVWLYFTLGLSDFDIKDATGLTLAQIESIKGLSLFDTIGNRIGSNLVALGKEDITARIDAMAARSADVLEAALDDPELDPALRVGVAKDMLDRAGHSAKQITEHRHKLEGGLIIKHIRETTIDSSAMPRVHIDINGAVDA